MTTATNKPSTPFWIISIIALIWNIMGVMAYLQQAYMSDEEKAILPEAERALYSDVPSWAIAAFAIAVFGGLLGSLALLLRKKWATPLFFISFFNSLFVRIQTYINLFCYAIWVNFFYFF